MTGIDPTPAALLADARRCLREFGAHLGELAAFYSETIWDSATTEPAAWQAPKRPRCNASSRWRTLWSPFTADLMI